MPRQFTKLEEVVIYKNKESYVHNPVVELLPDGEMLCAFREAPRRRQRTHIDMKSRGSLVRSRDGGKSWDPATKSTICPQAGGGIQDPSIRRLRDGTWIANYFQWTVGGADDYPIAHPWLQSASADHFSWTTGTFTTRSTDGGRTWEDPVTVPTPTGNATSTSDPILELPNGELLIPIEMEAPGERTKTGVARSTDGGRTWDDARVVAHDPLNHFSFHETGLLYHPSGKVIAMHRAHQVGEVEYGWYLYQNESRDGGRTWSPLKKTNIWGHPANLTLLDSGHILCVYGYRRPPYGVRACLSRDEGATWDVANEFILRADGIDGDVGYPTSVQLKDGTIFTAWYLAEKDERTQGVGEKFSIFQYGSPQTFLGGTLYREA